MNAYTDNTPKQHPVLGGVNVWKSMKRASRPRALAPAPVPFEPCTAVETGKPVEHPQPGPAQVTWAPTAKKPFTA
jgi:hypothetical protein